MYSVKRLMDEMHIDRHDSFVFLDPSRSLGLAIKEASITIHRKSLRGSADFIIIPKDRPKSFTAKRSNRWWPGLCQMMDGISVSNNHNAFSDATWLGTFDNKFEVYESEHVDKRYLALVGKFGDGVEAVRTNDDSDDVIAELSMEWRTEGRFAQDGVPYSVSIMKKQYE